MDRIKSFLSNIAGYLIAALIGLMWLLSRKSPRVTAPVPKVEPKKVPETDEEVLEEARREGIIK